MGNTASGKKNLECIWNNEEKCLVERSYELVSGKTGSSGVVHRQQLNDYFSKILDDVFANYLLRYLFSSCFKGKHEDYIDFERYKEPFLVFEKKDKTAQVELMVQCLPSSSIQDMKIHIPEIIKFITAIVISYKKAMPFFCKTYTFWQGYNYSNTTAEALALATLNDLTRENQICTTNVHELHNFYDSSMIIQVMLRQLLAFFYGYRTLNNVEKLKSQHFEPLLPTVEGIPSSDNYVPMLEIPHIIFIRDTLPYDLRDKWRFLFSSKSMGESFSTMLGKILNRGPTLIVVEDEDNYMFAGYAPVSWTLSPNFNGNCTSLLFALSPHMRSFNATGYNDHYQYLNLNQQTMPNGLGMGGQFNYWGLWIDCEYGIGQSSESCSTFRNYVQLSKKKNFRIRNLEVWGLGNEPRCDENSDGNEYEEDVSRKNKRSVLDKNLEDRVMLELSGRKIHSDGFRE